MQLNDDLLAAYLSRKPSQPSFVSVCWSAKSKLEPKLLCECFLKAKGSLVIKFSILLDNAVGFSYLLLRERLHPDQ